MRSIFGILLLVLGVVLAVFSDIARKSGKPNGRPASSMLACLVPPIIGNSLIILSGDHLTATVGCYLYYLGMDLIMAALLHFTFSYCRITWPDKRSRNFVYSLLAVDVVQLLLNPLFHHAFTTEPIQVDGFPYYRLVPLLGQTFHRVVDYIILAGVLVVFLVRLIRSPRLQAERYSAMFFSMVVVSLWETAYIFSGSPIDRSMIGFGVFGILVFYFSLYYRPMRLLDRMLGTIVSGQSSAMFFFDANQKCIWMNDAGRQLLQLDESETERAGNELERMFGERHPDENDWSDQVVLTGEDGTRRYYILSKHPLLDLKKQFNGCYVTVEDETEGRQALETQLYNARHDRLTGLYNRDYLYERTRELLNSYPDTEFLVVYADISDFKTVNDLYGYAFGDFVLQRTARWVEEDIPGISVCGRLSGDTFGVCLPAEGFHQSLTEKKLFSFEVSDGQTVYHLLIHVGIYPVRDRNLDVSVMYDRAHMALATIANQYHIHTAWYEDSMRQNNLWNKRISNELSAALAKGEIRPWLQPIVDRNGRTVGAEALARWIHPEGGLLSPSSFIPVFEQNGMIADVDRYIWRQSCEILASWQRENRDLFLSVNISPRDFDFLDVSGELRKLVGLYGIRPELLRLEITESAMISETESRLKILNSLREDGFIIEMDDFGSGYSSLNLLKDLPVDMLKIDMSFLNSSGRAGRAETILRRMIALAEDLGITSLTEGVETESQYRILADMGCQLYQGFLFARPMRPDDFLKFISRKE